MNQSPKRPGLVRRLLPPIALAVLLAIVLLLAIAALAIVAVLRGPLPERAVETLLAAATGARASVEDVDLRPEEGLALVSGVTLGSALRVHAARVEFEPGPLARGKPPRIVSVEIDGAVVTLSEATLGELAAMAERLASGGAGASGAAPRIPVRLSRAAVRVEHGGRAATFGPIEARLEPGGTLRAEGSGPGFEIDATAGEDGLRATLALDRRVAGPAADAAALLGAPAGSLPLSVRARVDAERPRPGERARIEVDASALVPPLPFLGAEGAPREVRLALVARAGAAGPIAVERLALAGLLESEIVASGEADPDARRVALRSLAPIRVPAPGADATLVVESLAAEARAPLVLRAIATARVERQEPGSPGDGATLRADATHADPGSDGRFEIACEVPVPLAEGSRGTVRASGRGRFSIGGATVDLDEARVEWPGLPALSASGRLDARARRVERIEVETEDEIDLAAAARALAALGVEKRGLAIGGALRLRATARGIDGSAPLAAPERLAIRLAARDVRFAGAPRGGAPIEGEGLRLDAALEAEREDDGALRGRLSGDVANLTLFVGDTLVDLEGRSLVLDAPLALDAAGRTLACEGVTVRAGDLGDIEGSAVVRLGPSGAVGPVAVEASVRVEGTSIETLFERTVLASAVAKFPSLAATAITGTLGAAVAVSGELGALRVEGAATIEDAGAASPDFSIADVSARIPVSFGAVSLGPRPGRVRVGSARVRGVSTGEIDLALLLGAGPGRRVLLLEPARVPLLGGTIEIADLRFDSVADAEAVVRVAGVDAARIGHVLDSPLVLAGTVESDGAIVIRASDDGIAADGALRARVLGGEVRIGSMRVDRPLGSIPRLSFDADAVDLDLAKVTAALAYSEIGGSVSLEARDVVIAPQGLERFVARFAAREAEGRPARATVKAIREIPFLATAGRLTLQGILFDLVNSFSYSRFGAVAALDAGDLRIHGRYAADGRDLYAGDAALELPFAPSGVAPEYAFIGTGLPDLDIVVEPPAKPIPFASFVRQIMSSRQARLE